MLKIKEIKEKLQSNPKEYHSLGLLVAKRVWLIITSLYYTSLLFTVGGFYIGPLSMYTFSMMTFHLYSLFVIATGWFFYSVCEYGILIYLPSGKGILRIITGILVCIFIALALGSHTGILEQFLF